MELRDYLRILRKRGWIILLDHAADCRRRVGLQPIADRSNTKARSTSSSGRNASTTARCWRPSKFCAALWRYIDSRNFAQQVITTLGWTCCPMTLKGKRDDRVQR